MGEELSYRQKEGFPRVLPSVLHLESLGLFVLAGPALFCIKWCRWVTAVQPTSLVKRRNTVSFGALMALEVWSMAST